MKKLVALYKVYRGGEWFNLSLNSIVNHVDGIVAIASAKPWIDHHYQENCLEPFNQFLKGCSKSFFAHYQVADTRQQEEQYKVGLQIIKERFGEDCNVLVIDTDEIWPKHCLDKLVENINKSAEELKIGQKDGTIIPSQRSAARVMRNRRGQNTFVPVMPGVFRTGIKTYLRSPLYEVWPQESGQPVTVVPAGITEIRGRFSGINGYSLNDIYFSHYPYIREDEEEISYKFMATNSQEHSKYKSDPGWMSNIWPNLPRGKSLHMTKGSETLWREIKILPRNKLAKEVYGLSFIKEVLRREEIRWQNCLERLQPNETLIPLPSKTDWLKYGDELREHGLTDENFYSIMRMNCLECLELINFANQTSKEASFLEVGSGMGGSLVCLAKGNKSAKLTSVDPYQPYNELTYAGLYIGHREGSIEQLQETAKHYEFTVRLGLVKEDSRKAFSLLQYSTAAPFDIVLIDGNHSYDIVKQDLYEYWSLVKPGGLLLGHDYTARFPGVIQAAKEFGIDGVLPGTCLFYKKKEV